MRLGILLACWLCSCLACAAPLRVGLENHDYYPYYSAVEGKPLDGYCIALLHAFAKHAGLELELRPQPVNRLYRSMLVEQNIDLLFPDNSEWGREAKAGQQLHYSRPVALIVDGSLVRREQLGQGQAAIKQLGVVRGFTAQAWLPALATGQVKLVEVQDIQSLIHMLERGRIDALYANPQVVRHHLRLLGIDEQRLQLDPQLPLINTSFHLSSYKHPELITGFDRFLVEEAGTLRALRQQYGLP